MSFIKQKDQIIVPASKMWRFTVFLYLAKIIVDWISLSFGLFVRQNRQFEDIRWKIVMFFSFFFLLHF